MSVDVVILLERSEEIVRVGEGLWREYDRPNIDLTRWRQLALELARRAADGAHARAEIFLCLGERHLVESYDHAFIEELLKTANNSSWGGKVRLVADQHIEGYLEHLETVDSLKIWLVAARDSHAVDVSLASFERDGNEEHLPSPLRRAGDSSEVRYRVLPRLVAPGQWEVWPASKDVANLLREARGQTEHYVPGKNLLIVVSRDSSTSFLAKQRIGELLAKHPEGRFALGVLGNTSKPDPVKGREARLPNWVAGLSKEFPFVNVVEFGGLLELRYFLLRLNEFCPTDLWPAPGNVESVALSPRPGALHVPNYSPNLLITSAFNPSERKRNCWESSQDVGQLLKTVAFRPNYLVHPGLRKDDLRGLFKAMPEPTAWLFLGHGHGHRGLQDADGKIYKAEEWLKALVGNCHSLPLAFFSACSSADMAKRFAVAGVGVTVGFKGRIMPEPCRLMANRVIRAALDSHGNREEILRAFQAGCRELQKDYGRIEPRAFYAVR